MYVPLYRPRIKTHVSRGNFIPCLALSIALSRDNYVTVTAFKARLHGTTATAINASNLLHCSPRGYSHGAIVTPTLSQNEFGKYQ